MTLLDARRVLTPDQPPPVIAWVDPLPGWPTKALKYAAIVTAIIDRPNTWALVRRNPRRAPLASMRNVITNARKSYRRHLAPNGRIHTAIRLTPSGDYGLWLKYTPDQQEEPS